MIFAAILTTVNLLYSDSFTLEAYSRDTLPSEVQKANSVNDTCVVYINWDGFARYYYDYAKSRGLTPVIDSLAKNGVMFNNAYTLIPSITDAMQSAIVSGATPSVTGNVYRYYDKALGEVIQQQYENKAETIAQAVYNQGYDVASIQQFTLENKGTIPGNVNCPYISTDGGKGHYSDYAARFDAAIKLIKGEPSGSPKSIIMSKIPKFLALYMDDLDGIGHNFEKTYGVKTSATEQNRLNSVAKRLGEMDKKLGEFISACKERGIYDNMAFVLTTDHGMAPFGQQGTSNDDYQSKLPDLLNTLNKLNYKAEVLYGGQKPKADTDIAIVTSGLELQLSFTKDYTNYDIYKIIKALKSKPYVEQLMTKGQLIENGCPDTFADLLVSPKPPYSFKPGNGHYKACGQHDSLDEKAQHIFALMWGKGVKKNYQYNHKIHNIDFAKTMSYLMGLKPPKDSNGALLNLTLEK